METRISLRVRSLADTILEVDGLCKQFVQQHGKKQQKTQVLDHVTFSVEKNSFTSIVGPSGCGKSTLLNMLAGLEGNDGGTIKLGLNGTRIAYVFQTSRLMPWGKVIDNVEFAHDPKEPREKVHDMALKCLKMVGLEEWTDVYPHQLSGGMQQRVGIARALSIEPDLLLMDEPFSHLDEITAKQMRSDLIDIWEKTSTTIVFVTHDMSEAVFLSDAIIFLTSKPARISRTVRIDLPRPRRYDDPAYFHLQVKLGNEFEEEIAEESRTRLEESRAKVSKTTPGYSLPPEHVFI